MSRVLLMYINNTVKNQNFQHSLFFEKRVTSMEDDSLLQKVENLQQKEYEHQIRYLLTNATHLLYDMTALLNCVDVREQGEEFLNDGIANLIPSVKHNYTGQVFVMHFQQSNRTDYENLKLLCRCFGLFYSSHQAPRGLHNNMLRFIWKTSHVFLIGTTSPYYSMKLGSNFQ
ncbi:uncharacterized protein LOC111620824 [Centruroides sculpturatus]|uniref:uncharacterized protein LOC111620824 n=1 Tax=Centruroides sculpturatus TaxID=218467 RepID=UPI000C6E2B09|nr:uncharacterized protein LOC111620824 [Centruroides sculpturatus]